MKSPAILKKLEAYELNWCIRVNRACAYQLIRNFFAGVSWLGDGRIWYGLMLTLPVVFAEAGFQASVDMMIAALVGYSIYKLIKNNTHRPRPYMRDQAITLGARPLDQYSFPSGHTLHAVLFTVIGVAHLPELAVLLAPFTMLVAASRVILGLHYPTDVVLGGLIGYGVAKLILVLPGCL